MEVKSPNVEEVGDGKPPRGLVVRVKNFDGGDVESELTADGRTKFKKGSNVKRGKKSKVSGSQFELRVRADLEGKGWVVDKWSNNVNLLDGKLIPAKTEWKYNPFRKAMMPQAQGTGFPDFVALQHLDGYSYSVIGVEVKTNGSLSKDEKLRCKWLLDNKVFSQILVASKVKVKNRVRVEYVDVNEILSRMR